MTDNGNPGTTDPTQNINPAPSSQGNHNDIPQWARDAITKGNNEAAKFRTDLRTKTEEHTAVLAQIDTLTNDKTALQDKVSQADLSLLKVNIALDAGVPGARVRSIADRLVGSNEEELKADAAKLVQEFGLTNQTAPATDPSQGQGTNASDANLTPGAAAFAQMVRGQLTR